MPKFENGATWSVLDDEEYERSFMFRNIFVHILNRPYQPCRKLFMVGNQRFHMPNFETGATWSVLDEEYERSCTTEPNFT